MNKTSFTEEQEEAMLKELEPIVRKWANQSQLFPGNTEHTEESIAYLWADRKRQKEEDYRAYLSSHDIGLYGGR